MQQAKPARLVTTSIAVRWGEPAFQAHAVADGSPGLFAEHTGLRWAASFAAIRPPLRASDPLAPQPFAGQQASGMPVVLPAPGQPPQLASGPRLQSAQNVRP